jgi:hypothetical protein
MKNFHKIFIVALLFNTLSISCAESVIPADDDPIEKPVQKPGVENSGIFAIWYGNKTEYSHYPWSLVVRLWFSGAMLRKVKIIMTFLLLQRKWLELKAMGKLATIQINGNNKPDYLFDEVPWVEEKLSHQVQDTKGSLMYWHPNHVNAYKNLLKALGGYLSGRKSDFIGIRMNYNPFGTEHTHLSRSDLPGCLKMELPCWC